MSGKRISEEVEEHAKKPKLEVEISTKIMNTKGIPVVVWQKIFGFFSLEEIKLKVARVCRHFYEISNDCVQKVVIDEKIFDSKRKYDMIDALPTFKYLKTVKIECDPDFLDSENVDFFVKYTLKYCPQVRHLEIVYHELSKHLIEQIIKHGQNLSALDLDLDGRYKEFKIFPGSYACLMEMKHLKHLGLRKMGQDLRTEDLLTLIENNKELNSLLLFGCEFAYQKTAENTIIKILNLKKEKLKKFDFCGDIKGNEWLKLLENCPKLKHLTLSEVCITNSGFQAISKLKNLNFLQLGYDRDSTEIRHKADDIIKMFSNGKFKYLKELLVNGIINSIVPILTCALVACPNLQFLQCECVTDNRKDFPTNIIKLLFDHLAELRKIHFIWANEELDIVRKNS